MIVIVGEQLLAVIGATYYLSRQINVAGARQTTGLHESERRLTEQFQGLERRLNEQIGGIERRLTKQYRETNRDTKTLIRDVGFLQGSLGVARRRQESDPDAEAGAVD